MRILNVISTVDPTHGGPIEGLKQLSRVLEANGHSVEIASLDDPQAPFVKECPVPVHALGPGKGVFGFTPHFVPWLRSHHSDYDVVLVRGVWQYGGLATRKALRKTGTPYFVFTHGMLDPWFKKTYPLKHLKKVVYWLFSEYKVLHDAKGVCFTCDEERVLARESFRPYKVKEIVVRYGTAGPDDRPAEQRAAFLKRFPQLSDKRVFLFISRIHAKKGCDLLIEAFAQIAAQDLNLHLVMAGPDQTGWQTELEELARKLGIAERITWTGMLAGDEKWGAFRCAEVFALPSHQENFGIVVAEALACSVPVLISDKVNIWREIDAGGAGYVAPDTLEGTTQLLEKWMEIPAVKREAMRRKALECFRRNFEIQGAAQSLIGAIEAEVGKK
jgi:glycosyltransferase involved in cell wall biosynthesis